MNPQIHRIGAVAAAAATFFGAAAGAAAAGAAAAGFRFPDDRSDHSPAVITAGQNRNLAPDDFVWHRPPPARAMAVPVAVAQRVEPGFDWVDAGIGALAVVGLGLVGAGAVLVTRTQRRSTALS